LDTGEQNNARSSDIRYYFIIKHENHRADGRENGGWDWNNENNITNKIHRGKK
jgi:hypothetical protein